jgi:hypothetical protein
MAKNARLNRARKILASVGVDTTRCGICGRSDDVGGRRLAVDHCHSFGRVRGVLCTRCNVGLVPLARLALHAAPALAPVFADFADVVRFARPAPGYVQPHSQGQRSVGDVGLG